MKAIVFCFFWEGRTEMKSNWIVEYNFYKMGE